jgi:hypothetical protein
MIWAGNVAGMRKKRNAFMDFVGKHEGKGLLGRYRRRREDNIKIDIVDILLGACERDSFDSGGGPEVRSCGPVVAQNVKNFITR